MTENEQRSAFSPDPFILPGDDTVRFVLFLAAIGGSSLFILDVLAFRYASGSHLYVHAVVRCLRVGGRLRPWPQVSACIAASVRPVVLRIVLAGLLLMGTGIAVSLAAPLLLQRRRGFRPMGSFAPPSLTSELAQLCTGAGIREPRWLVDPLDARVSARAIGTWLRQSVVLSAGLVRTFEADLAVFRGVVRHELAHLRNRDGPLLYATVGAWWAFVVLALVPFAFSLAGEPVSFSAGVGLRLICLGGLLLLVRNAVLRSRELYADARAASWDARDGGLRRALAAGKGEGHQLPAWTWTHPAAGQRLAVLADPASLWRPRPADVFGAGLFAAAAASSVQMFLGLLGWGTAAWAWAFLIVAPLVAGVAGVQAWRTAIGVGERGSWRYPLLSGLALGLGILVGMALGLPSAAGGTPGLSWGTPAWTLGLVLGCVLFTGWLSSTARCWSRGGWAPPVLRIRAAVSIGAAAAVLAASLTLFFLWRDQQPLLPVLGDAASIRYATVAAHFPVGPAWLWQLMWHPAVVAAVLRPISLAVVSALWIVPAAAAAWNHAERRDLLTAVSMGAVGGTVAVTELILLRLWLHHALPAKERELAAFPYAFNHWMVLLVGLTMAAVAAVTAAMVRQGAVHGLAAAFVSGGFSVLAVLILPPVAACVSPLELPRDIACGAMPGLDNAWYDARLFLVVGMLLSVPAAVAGHAMGRLSAHGVAPGSAERGTRWRRRLAVPVIPVMIFILAAAALVLSRHAAAATNRVSTNERWLSLADVPAGWIPHERHVSPDVLMVDDLLRDCIGAPDPGERNAQHSPVFVDPFHPPRLVFADIMTAGPATVQGFLDAVRAPVAAGCIRATYGPLTSGKVLSVSPLRLLGSAVGWRTKEVLYHAPGTRRFYIDRVFLGHGTQVAMIIMQSPDKPFPAGVAERLESTLERRLR